MSLTDAEAQELLGQVVRSSNRFRGRLAALVESWGLDPTRERAMIGIMKSLSYTHEGDLAAAILVLAPEATVNEWHDKYR